MIPFNPTAPINSFTAATSAPTSVQSLPLSDVANQQYVLTNTDASIDATVGWGQTDAEAKANAVAGNSQRQFWLVHGTQVVITAAPGAYFTGITGSSTAVIKVQAGYMG